MSHTPGPWKSCHKSNDFGEGHEASIYQVRGKGHLIASLNNGAIGNGMDPDTFHANASLIAAAPDILESLLDYYHLPEVWVNDPDGTVADAVKAEVRERARAAIAKATGEDSV